MLKSFFLDFFAKFLSQIVGFVVSVFLTRLLSPSEFGIMGIALIIISFSVIFVDLGFGKAIIQQSEVKRSQLNNIFFINLASSIFFSALCFFLSYPIASFFNQPMLCPIVQTLSLSFIFSGLNVVPNALLYKRTDFRAISIISFTSVVISGIVGVLMAENGFGVWSLVAQNLLMTFLSFLFTSLYLKWIPDFDVSLKKVKGMWHYSSRLFLSGLLDTMFSRLDVFIIGKIFTPTSLGFYTRAQSFDGVIRQISCASITSVLFPYISKIHTDIERVKNLYLNYLNVITCIAFFFYGLLFLIVKPLFIILFTEKWIEAAVIFKIIVLAGFVYPISALMVTILSARGNSKAYLRAEIFKKLVMLPAYLVGFFVGLHSFIYCIVGASIMALLINTYFVGKELNIDIFLQWKIIIKYWLITAIIVLGILLFENIVVFENEWLTLIITSGLFVVLFVIINMLLLTPAYQTIKQKIQYIYKK